MFCTIVHSYSIYTVLFVSKSPNIFWIYCVLFFKFWFCLYCTLQIRDIKKNTGSIRLFRNRRLSIFSIIISTCNYCFPFFDHINEILKRLELLLGYIFYKNVFVTSCNYVAKTTKSQEKKTRYFTDMNAS